MKLARFRIGTKDGFGLVEGDRILDVSDAPGLSCGIPGFLAGGEPARVALRAAAAGARSLPLAEVRLLAPVPHPP